MLSAVVLQTINASLQKLPLQSLPQIENNRNFNTSFMKPELFEYQITVPATAIDDMNHVNNVTYLQWIQDIAKKHWESKTNEQIRNTYVWVVLNHYIEYHQPAFEQDMLTIQTWIDHHRGARSERHTKIINTTTQKVVVTAKTSWCFLAKEKLRPTRITEEISSLFS